MTSSRAVVLRWHRCFSVNTQLSKAEEKALQEEGILDERGLVVFDTLHNMQTRSCRVFAPKNLFATYSEETKNFEWMSFAECKSSSLH